MRERRLVAQLTAVRAEEGSFGHNGGGGGRRVNQESLQYLQCNILMLFKSKN